MVVGRGLPGSSAVRHTILAMQNKPERAREQPPGADRFRLLVDAVVDYGIFMLDPEGYVATWNAGAQRIKGYDAQEIIGQHFSKFYPEEDKHWKPKMELAEVVRTGRFEDFGWRIRKDGTRLWANVVITAML